MLTEGLRQKMRHHSSWLPPGKTENSDIFPTRVTRRRGKRKLSTRLIRFTIVPKKTEYKLPDEIVRAMREREEHFND